MQTHYTIRQVDTENSGVVNTLTDLHKHCLPADDLPDFTKGWWWIMYDRNKYPAGFAGLVPSNRWIDCGYLSRAGILLYHRGKGLQKRLIHARILKARKLGYEYLFSDTHDNVPSVNNLIACGFKLYDPRTPYGAEKTLYWRLKLKPICHTKTPKKPKRSKLNTPKNITRRIKTR